MNTFIWQPTFAGRRLLIQFPVFSHYHFEPPFTACILNWGVYTNKHTNVYFFVTQFWIAFWLFDNCLSNLFAVYFFQLQLLVSNFFLLPVIISSNIWTKLCFHRLSVSDFFLFTFSHWLSASNVKPFSPFFPSSSCIKTFSLYFFHRLSVSVQ